LRDDLCGVGLNDIQYGLVMQAADEIEELCATLEKMSQYASLDWHQFYDGSTKLRGGNNLDMLAVGNVPGDGK